MYKGSIVFKAKDQLIPDEYLNKVLAEYPTAVSCTMAMDEGDISYLEMSPLFAPLDVAAIKKLQEDFKEEALLFYFANYPDGFMHEDMQPLPIFADEQGKQQLVAFIDGECKPFLEPGVNHSGAFNAVEKFIEPKLQAMAEVHDGDLDGFMELMDVDNAVLKHELMSITLTEPCTIVFFAANGMVRTFSRNTAERNYPWGYASQGLEIQPKVGEYPDKTEEPKKKTFSFGKKSVLSLPASTAPSKSLPEGVHSVPAEEFVLVGYPDSMKKASNKERKNFHHKVFGRQHENWADLSAVWPATKAQYEKAIKNGWINKPDTFKDFKTAAVALSTEKSKDTGNHHIPTAEGAIKSTAAFTPFISPESRDKLAALHLKFMDKPADKLKIKEWETKWPSYAEYNGIATKDTWDWDVEQLKEIQDADPNAFLILAMNWRIVAKTLDARLPKNEDDLKKAEPATPATKSEPDDGTVIKGSFNFKKKSA